MLVAMSQLVIGHRGAAGSRPQHTLASYELSIRLGADVIEPDLVTTRDGVLVARHEPEISGTTDVARHPEFADRRTTRTVDGVVTTGWFTDDFTLPELRTLRAVERIPQLRPHNALYDGRDRIPTLQEVVDLARRASREHGRRIGIAPETKHPTYFRERGKPLEPALVRVLTRTGLNRPDAGVYVQSFEVANLVALRSRLRVDLVQLTAPGRGTVGLRRRRRPADVRGPGHPGRAGQIARYADALGPDKTQIVPRDGAGASLPATTLVRDAHRAGLAVLPYTFRNENAFLPAELRCGAEPGAYGDAFTEYAQFLRLGVDGVFTDNGDTAREARDRYALGRRRRAAG